MQLIQKITILLIATFLTGNLPAQDGQNAWRTLAMMKYERQDESNAAPKGKFIEMIEALEGKEISLKGYVVPLSGKKAQSHFMFSAYPYNNCFFCGQAGPETVIEVFAKDGQLISFSEKAVEVKGIFKFTSRNTDGVMFTLEEAEMVE